MINQKQIIEKIRKIRFGKGLDTKNLTGDQKAALKDKDKILKDATKLAKEINTENFRSIFELIQNAADNKYEKEIKPKIKFIKSSGCLIIKNNEKGFEERNVWALCGIGESTKKNKALGYIGEKGIGFKSVFMVANEVNIYSNGFQFRFKYDESNPVTMIIPEWVDEVPDFIDKNQTNIILHFKPEVKNEISSYFKKIHPPLLLFLRRLKVIEIEKNDKNSVERIELSEKKDETFEIVYGEEKNYWKVKKKSFGVPHDIEEERRKDITKTEIVLAFPINEDGFPETSNEQDVFAFLPVSGYGFKFIIQADFILHISREDIIKDNKWNKWLRDSIVEVFLDAVSKFKNDEKIKYNFYNYLPLEEVKDDFFVPVVEQIYERLKEEDCILTEAGRWKKPSEVLIGDEKIKKIVTNEDLQEFFGKEYLSERIKAKKTVKKVLHDKLGIKDFSTNELIKFLKNTEWIEKQNDEWFARLFRYLGKKGPYYRQLEQLKDLKIIKLENGKLTSINEKVVFLRLEKKEVYGFESELRVIKKEIMDIISKYEKEEEEEEKNRIRDFLKELGLKPADPYWIIENHILPVYEDEDEDEECRHKDSKVLMGYIRYIKDNIDKYEKESDRKLNADTLEQLKKSVLIRIDKDAEGKEWYDNPKNIYLPKIYGNENNLEELFEGIDASFVHPCYIKDNLKSHEEKLTFLKNRVKDKGKRWKKKNKKEVKEIEKQIKKLEYEKNKKISEWKEFFSKIGVWDTLIVKKDPYTEIYEGPDYANNEVTKKFLYKDFDGYSGSRWKGISVWQDDKWKNTDWKYYIGDDWLSYDFLKIIEKIRKKPIDERIKFAGQLCNLINRYGQNMYKKYMQCKYYYRYYGQTGWRTDVTNSTFCLKLRTESWLPTSLKTLAKPSEVFLDKPEIREVLGDNVPYLTVKIRNEDFIGTLDLNTQADVKGVLNYLRALVEQKNEDKEKFEKLYKFLDEHFEDNCPKINEEFAENFLIFVQDTEKKYHSIKEVLWKDVSYIFGENRIYLKKYYPNLKKFFVEKLGINEKPTPEYYANVLITISKKDEISDEDRKIILGIYEELNCNLDSDKVENPISQEDWWNDFNEKSIFLTNKGEFQSNDEDIFINDDKELHDLFKDEGDIGLLWLPEGCHPDKIKFFIKACNIRYLSESVETKPLLEELTYPKDEKLILRLRKIVPFVLRYLYWKENSIYKKLKENKKFEKIMAIKVYVTDNLKVKYSIKVNEWKLVDNEAERKCIYHDSSLYLNKNDNSIYDLAVEFSKVFGEIKGLDDFVMNIMNDLHNAENIMKAKNIGDLPEYEQEILKKLLEIRKVEGKEESSKRGSPDKSPEEKHSQRDAGDVDLASSTLSKENPERKRTSTKDQESTTETGEDEWVPECSPDEAEINIKEYKKYKPDTLITRGDEEDGKHPNRPSSSTPSRSDTLSKKQPKEIGKWGEKYALRCIKKELGEKYSDATLEDTEQGFKLEEKDNVIGKVEWLNKDGESGKHYDIKIVENGKEMFIEIKSTKDYDIDWFRLSKDQWKLMKEKGDEYYIYRVYNAGKRNEAKLEIVHNPAKLWKEGYIIADPIKIQL